MMKSNAQALTAERGKTHGSFATNAQISQDLKHYLRMQPGWYQMSNVQKEALDVIALKVSRILSGQSFFLDHWADTGGYAELACQEIRNLENRNGSATAAAISDNLARPKGRQDRGRKKSGPRP